MLYCIFSFHEISVICRRGRVCFASSARIGTDIQAESVVRGRKLDVIEADVLSLKTKLNAPSSDPPLPLNEVERLIGVIGDINKRIQDVSVLLKHDTDDNSIKFDHASRLQRVNGILKDFSTLLINKAMPNRSSAADDAERARQRIVAREAERKQAVIELRGVLAYLKSAGVVITNATVLDELMTHKGGFR